MASQDDPCGPSTVDLTESVESTLVLLDDTLAWRQRLVEKFTFHDASHVSVASSYRIELTPAFLQEFVPAGATSVNLLLPVTTRPKRPLLNFGIRVGMAGEAFVLPRRANADIQARYLRRMCRTSPAPDGGLAGLTFPLLYAICSFTPDPWREFLASEGGDPPRALARYLASGLGFAIAATDLERWQQLAGYAGQQLVAALEEPPDGESPSENVLLALPALWQLPTSADEVDAIVRGFSCAVHNAASAGDHDLMSVLAEYGRRWEVIVEAQVPTYRPAVVHLTEDRPLGLDRGRTVQRVALGDAGSVHFEARVMDHHVKLAAWRVHDLVGHPVGVPLFESARLTKETLSLYTSVSDRPYYVDVHLRFRIAPHVRWVTPGALVLTSSAIVGLLLVAGDALVDRLAMLLFPATFAVAFLLTREETPLAAALHHRLRWWLGTAVVCLWAVALARLLIDGSFIPTLVQAGPALWENLTAPISYSLRVLMERIAGMIGS